MTKTVTPSIILGPPGTGKTTTLISLVKDALARGVPPDRIGYFSFTRKAAQEAMDRACEEFQLTKKDFPYFSTLHSMCFKQLGMKRADVLEGNKLQEFARYAGVKITGSWSEDGTLTGFDTGDRILFMENLSRIRGIPLRKLYDEFDDALPWSEVKRVADSLAEFKRAHELVDFTDMLSTFVKSGIRLGLEELLVDEAQDLSKLQWRVVERLTEGCKKVSIAGDDDQAIYRWAGADVDHLIEMQGDVRVLGQSYRVPPVIQNIAHGIISGVKHRRPKKWSARTGDEGSETYETSFEHADCDAGQVLVLARNAYIIREQIEPELRRQGIIYERNGRSSIKPSLIDIIRSWEALRRGQPITVEEIKKIYEWMTVGQGFKRGFKQLPGEDDEREMTIDELKKSGGLLRVDPWHSALDRLPRNDVSYVRAALKRGEKVSQKPRVVVSTIHAAKGGEADHVVLMKEIAGRTYREMRKNPEDERRCWYVGVTRARQKITIVEAKTARRCPWI